jgi:hypothetical protein
MAVVAPVVCAVWPPGEAVTVYPVIADPPSVCGMVQEMTAWPLPLVADTPVGTPGEVIGVPKAASIGDKDVPAVKVTHVGVLVSDVLS